MPGPRMMPCRREAIGVGMMDAPSVPVGVRALWRTTEGGALRDYQQASMGQGPALNLEGRLVEVYLEGARATSIQEHDGAPESAPHE